MTLPLLNAADEEALDAILAVRPVWRSLKKAGDAIGLGRETLLHAGPAFVSVDGITRPIRNSACIAAVIEELAPDFEAAASAIDAGEISLQPAQDYSVVTPLAAVVSSSMWLHEVVNTKDPSHTAFAPIKWRQWPSHAAGVL